MLLRPQGLPRGRLDMPRSAIKRIFALCFVRQLPPATNDVGGNNDVAWPEGVQNE
jgi:hypothetical protein